MPKKGDTISQEQKQAISDGQRRAFAALPYVCICGSRRAGWALMRDHHSRCLKHRKAVALKKGAASPTGPAPMTTREETSNG